MKTLIASAALVSAIAAAPAAFAIQPAAIPETGTLSNTPVGSVVAIDGQDRFGDNYENFFIVQQDGSLKLAYQQNAAD